MEEREENRERALSEVAMTDEEIPEEISELLENVPPEHRKEIEKFMISTVQMRGVSMPEMELMKKINDEHITTYLESAKEEMEMSYKERGQNKFFIAGVLLSTMIFIVVIILILKDIPDVMEKVLYALIGLVTGILGGYGIGKNKSDS